MKKDFTHENFERFLKENADELHMQPADGVWNRIESRLNRRRRWVFFTSGFFLLTASLCGYVIINDSKHPSNPFAGIRPIQKEVASPEATPQPFAANTTKVVSKKATSHLTTAVAATELFQKPIPITTVPGVSASTPQTAFVTTPVDEQQPVVETAVKPVLQHTFKATDVPAIESVVNSYMPKKRRNKSEFQLFFTPTISYRRLTENKSYLRAVPQSQASVNLAALYDVNSLVTHKPDLGLELGVAYKFAVNNSLKLRTGLQFNIMRYGIKAFTYVPERATIALNSRAHGIDSVSTISSYRTYNGGRPDWLQNFYFQVSAPIGVEVALKSHQKTRFGIATTVQPTYVLGDRAYLISTDYKNYSQVPWLIRRWNVNTSLETFVSYSTGKLRWQVGPQVRYQLLSSFIQQYPVKENLFDFGMKVGVSLDKK